MEERMEVKIRVAPFTLLCQRTDQLTDICLRIKYRQRGGGVVLCPHEL